MSHPHTSKRLERSVVRTRRKRHHAAVGVLRHNRRTLKLWMSVAEVKAALQITDTDVAATVESVVGPLRRLGTTVHVKVQRASISTDSGRGSQIKSNLVSNALKHGGPTVWVTGAAVPGGYLLRVADDGSGVVVTVIVGPRVCLTRTSPTDGTNCMFSEKSDSESKYVGRSTI